MGEFELIRRHFQRRAQVQPATGTVALGIGDDCALLVPQAGHQLAVSSDMLVEGRHFFPDVDPAALGHKTLAVNLSDLAAMGARPLGFTLALALPIVDDLWLNRFADGLQALADASACPLVGGDTTRGPLNLCATVMGDVARGKALRRDGARPDDDLWLSGRTGEARLALERLKGTGWALDAPGDLALCRQRLERPAPRLALGQALAGTAHAAIDLSDGLAGDLGHILCASGVGAEIERNGLPLAPALGALAETHRLECLLHGGDDYELLFTAPAHARDAVMAIGQRTHTPLTRIGRITRTAGLWLCNADGTRQPLQAAGYDHFR